MKTLIALILILLYLFIGISIFNAAVKSYGGKEAYKAQIEDGGSYTFAFIMVVLFWPVFIIRAIKRQQEE